MDWYLDARDPVAAQELRHEVRSYLERHAEAASDLEAAELAFGELVANAVRHASGPAWVHLDWGGREPVVEVHDLGPGFRLEECMGLPAPRQEGGRGLFIVAHLASELSVAAKRTGGSRVRAVLPVRRPVEKSHDPLRHRTGVLPTPEEASPEGTFGRESFLRALVVQLAQVAEGQAGPDAAEAMVAQVGADVGGRMEDEYRRAREIVSRLTPEQIADLYVRLKAAIGGDFYLIEADEHRIVLGNRRCPFGDAVKRAPGLCRMTSSVFGGIAARNAGGGTVVLEERIAVGDPECRVVVWLGDSRPDSNGTAAVGHEYAGSE